MNKKKELRGEIDSDDKQALSFVADMLVELRTVSENAGAEFLTYLIDMAYMEAADLSAGEGKVPRKSDSPSKLH